MLGLARSGEAAALALARRGVRVLGVDRRPDADVGRLREAGVEVVLGADADVALVERVQVLVKSPGVPSEAPLVAAARELGLPVWSEIELGARLVAQPTVAVTGTNGKTTTTELLGAIFRAAGAAGRRLRQRRPAALRARREALVRRVRRLRALELPARGRRRRSVAMSPSFSTSPPDHLDRHGSLDAYREAKLRIFERQEAGDAAVVPSGFGAIPGSGRRIEFRADDDLPAEPLIPGAHNRENAAAATAAARAAGIADDAIAEALRTFPGVAHRLEPVRELAGVRFVNDSKATNPESAERALEAYPPGTLRVILGGSRKQGAFDSLARVASRRAVLAAYLIGETAGELADALETQAVAFERCGELENAVARAAADARPGEVVLLSPACASFDQFRDFEQRGERFRELVRRSR